jgi:hypothetical protein
MAAAMVQDREVNGFSPGRAWDRDYSGSHRNVGGDAALPPDRGLASSWGAWQDGSNAAEPREFRLRKITRSGCAEVRTAPIGQGETAWHKSRQSTYRGSSTIAR